ncbi:hypothetical protein SAMN05216267_106227 [Actinacidiphila rubida]|uniref:Uncharacterized protein n=1 Tax=Actinacidiphila rubida TaxID=310780 RepID=A0A1H8U1K9_9ACTN|nr:hypothetical protein SAMN05216267_106227 [Actinacidiphila rubida]
MGWETAELEGGPADGTRIRVSGRPRVLQVTAECPLEDAGHDVRVAAVYVYRRVGGVPPLRYAWDWASP